MTTGRPFHGRLFAEDFLGESIQKFDDWRGIPDAELDDLEAALGGVFDRFPTDRSPKKSAVKVRNRRFRRPCRAR